MDDERLAKIEQEKQNAINQSNNTYNGLLQDNQNIYNQQQEYANQYEKTQNEALDKQLAFNEQKINQQKEIAKQNMETEQKKAKNDFVSYTNPYGLQAEQFASQGLLNSGVSETAKLGGFNSYQNRLASANKAMQDAFVQYDNDMNQARLNNDVQKAQNALAKLEMQLKYSESFYNNKSTITQNLLSNNQQLDSDYYNRYQTTYNNIQTEKQRAEAIRQWEAELAEKQRQYNENMAFQKSESQRQQANWEKEYALSKVAAARKSSGGGSGSNNKPNGELPIGDGTEEQPIETITVQGDNPWLSMAQMAVNAAREPSIIASTNSALKTINSQKGTKAQQNTATKMLNSGKISQEVFLRIAEQKKW